MKQVRQSVGLIVYSALPHTLLSMVEVKGHPSSGGEVSPREKVGWQHRGRNSTLSCSSQPNVTTLGESEEGGAQLHHPPPSFHGPHLQDNNRLFRRVSSSCSST